ncbi:UDP-glucose/GDP-mannose dehydrogenase family protein [Kitasatospora sp. MAP5-34]|uniref:UDP-glucose dehydrogenase family protein n=1 Tax=Kitasatospora sp. MAP5-34 TaxID=3035102 RepID=UPI002473B096|nr:UDP-glucose/GDP-mannose dehydrogenase family protein [Kitasatospora sp. MAP5-34]MDH6577214.1 UDPglucose 6-dehydrogenase [Kitasatospora sp. MAP5-34]
MVGTSGRQIAVFGAGYIGLVTGACLAELGHKVVVRDINPERVQVLQAGDVPIYEPGLGDMIARNKERLTFTLDLEEVLADAEVAYVCVDTPPSASGDADLSRVWSVIRSLAGAPHLQAVVMKSTVPVGTGSRVRAVLDETGLTHVGYASNPEFTAEGKAVADFMKPDRIVIGADSPAAGALVEQLHAGVDSPVVAMDVRSAEMVKLASNALLATRISFANEIATLCENTGADAEEVLRAVGLDHRLGPHFLRPGIGWGGSCFPKDSEALRQMASNTGFHPPLLSAVIDVNNIQKRRAIQKLTDQLGTLADARVALLGMAFKPGTDDMREAPSTVLATRLLAEGAQVRCWDPLARPAEVEPWTSATRYASPEKAMADADAAVVVTEWPQLQDVDWVRAAQGMRRPVLFDGRNLLEPKRMRAAGFTYMSVGRP